MTFELTNKYQPDDAELKYARGFSTDTHVAFSAAGGTTQVLSAVNAEPFYTLQDADFWANSLRIVKLGSNPSTELLLTTYRNAIRVYDLATGEPKPSFPSVHEGHLELFPVDPVGSAEDDAQCVTIASSDSNGYIVIWRLSPAGAELLHMLKGHDQTVVQVCRLSIDPNVLLSASYDGSLCLWDLSNGAQKEVHRLLDGSEPVRLSPDSDENQGVKHRSISSMICTTDGRIIFGGGSGYVRILDASNGNAHVRSWQAHFGGNRAVGPIVNKVIMHPSGKAFITTGTDGRIRLWDLDNYQCLRQIKPFEHSVLPGTITWLGTTLLCAGKDGSPANTCGDFCRAIAWDLADTHRQSGTGEICSDVFPACMFVHSMWAFENRVVAAVVRRGRVVVEIWTKQ